MSTDASDITCVGMIMDGNRRWAREQGLSTIKGHKAGYENFRNASKWCRNEGIQHLVVYAFSTENWNRSEEEVTYLMEMMRELLNGEAEKLQTEDNVAVHIVGELSMFPEDIQEKIETMHARNKEDTTFNLWIAASYGGRLEIVAGVNALLKEKKETVTEDNFKEVLWTANMPDPDIIIRTGGEKRLSNFLSWSSVYSELFFVDTYWPAFSENEFKEIVENYRNRKRNFGK